MMIWRNCNCINSFGEEKNATNVAESAPSIVESTLYIVYVVNGLGENALCMWMGDIGYPIAHLQAHIHYLSLTHTQKFSKQAAYNVSGL